MKVSIDGEKLRQRMRERGISARALSFQIGKYESYVEAALRRGKVNESGLDAICKTLKYPAGSLLTEEPKPATISRNCRVNEKRLWALIGATDKPISRMSTEAGLGVTTLGDVLKNGTASSRTIEKLGAYFGVTAEELIL